ncbi:hypothetical protein [Agrobacterium tumefaciens]|uniref:hypothetical protein n=1 Tax=Agrobacterium tumefaciens TaxID=358 RepID=UPI0021D284E7|nr:hypothetical protein [Agrobacterium tumefaciens]UXS01655.1 hypothetical protein FY156_09345 [Agrobacterium tumefaciens]
MTDISMDARVLVTCFFANGEKNSLKIGGVGAQSVFSDRAESAIKELVLGGFVTASEFNSFGRMEYVGTDKCLDARLSFEEMAEHGRWSATKPNPDRKVA